MQPQLYALVAYVKSSVGAFVERLRQEVHPDLPHLPAHITILPPRQLQGSELSALQTLEDLCRECDPFEVELGDVETFVPVTPTVFIRVAHGAYMPHLTIVKISSEELAQQAYLIARDHWAEFQGSRKILAKELTFVREEGLNRWVDLAGLPLGPRLVQR